MLNEEKIFSLNFKREHVEGLMEGFQMKFLSELITDSLLMRKLVRKLYFHFKTR